MHSDPTFLRAEKGQPQWLQFLAAPWSAQTTNFPISFTTAVYSAVDAFFYKNGAGWIDGAQQLGQVSLTYIKVPATSKTNEELRILILGQ